MEDEPALRVSSRLMAAPPRAARLRSRLRARARPRSARSGPVLVQQRQRAGSEPGPVVVERLVRSPAPSRRSRGRPSARATKVSSLASMLPASRLGTISTSARPATSESMPFGAGRHRGRSHCPSPAGRPPWRRGSGRARPSWTARRRRAWRNAGVDGPTADRMPTRGLAMPAGARQVDRVLRDVDLGRQVGRDVDRRVRDEQQVVEHRRVHHEHMAQAAAAAQAMLLLTTAASSSSEWIAPFMIAPTSPLRASATAVAAAARGSVSMQLLPARDVDAELGRDAAHALRVPDQQRFDQARGRRARRPHRVRILGADHGGAVAAGAWRPGARRRK